jgi:hypothetical protein
MIRATPDGVPTYRIILSDSGYTAEVTDDLGAVAVAHGFRSKEAALAWVGDRLIVRKDPVDRSPSHIRPRRATGRVT